MLSSTHDTDRQITIAPRQSPPPAWVDDERPAPDGWAWAKASDEAISLLGGVELVEAISLDHDLGGEDTTRPVVLWLAAHGGWPARVYVYTANPVGRQWLPLRDYYAHRIVCTLNRLTVFLVKQPLSARFRHDCRLNLG